MLLHRAGVDQSALERQRAAQLVAGTGVGDLSWAHWVAGPVAGFVPLAFSWAGNNCYPPTVEINESS